MPVAIETSENVVIPEGVQVTMDSNCTFTVSGPNGKLVRTLFHIRVKVTRKGNEFIFSCSMPRKKEKSMVGTFAAHLRNMCTGVKDGFTYPMKVVYSHFPIKVTLKGKQVLIENFLGEKKMRSANLIGDTKILIKGNDITLTGFCIEDVGQSAANIEKATHIKKRDPRVFQDGIYIIRGTV